MFLVIALSIIKIKNNGLDLYGISLPKYSRPLAYIIYDFYINRC